jgi:hypothetical protein
MSHSFHEADGIHSVAIEKSANLDILLSRLFGRTLAKDKYFSLQQNPRFYSKFPTNMTDFQPSSSFSGSESKASLPHIPALDVRDSVEIYEGKTLHIIVDQTTSSRVVILKNSSKVPLPEIFSNGWHLNGSTMAIAVREKGTCTWNRTGYLIIFLLSAGGSHNLLLWNVDESPVGFIPVASANKSNPSTATSVEVSI